MLWVNHRLSLCSPARKAPSKADGLSQFAVFVYAPPIRSLRDAGDGDRSEDRASSSQQSGGLHADLGCSKQSFESLRLCLRSVLRSRIAAHQGAAGYRSPLAAGLIPERASGVRARRHSTPQADRLARRAIRFARSRRAQRRGPRYQKRSAAMRPLARRLAQRASRCAWWHAGRGDAGVRDVQRLRSPLRGVARQRASQLTASPQLRPVDDEGALWGDQKTR